MPERPLEKAKVLVDLFVYRTPKFRREEVSKLQAGSRIRTTVSNLNSRRKTNL